MDYPPFATVRSTAALGFITEHHLRLRIKSGRCPGIYHGNRFLVNVYGLISAMDEESKIEGGNKKS